MQLKRRQALLRSTVDPQVVRFRAMNLLPPRVVGPLSECSHFVSVANATPDANVTIVVTRAATQIRAGRKTVKNAKDTVPLDAGFDLAGGDVVNAMQELAGDASAVSNDGPEVQRSVCTSARAGSSWAACVRARASSCWKTAP